MNETEINSCQIKNSKHCQIKNSTKLDKIIDRRSENFNKKFKNMKKNQSKLKNMITEMKSTLGGKWSRH